MSEQDTAEVIVVTGAGSGMGRDIAIDQARLGRHVVLVGRRLDPLQETAAAIASGSSTVVAADVSMRSGAEQLRTVLAGRPVTGFVAVAGGQGDFKDYDGDLQQAEDAWEQALRKNLYSALLPIEALLPQMVDRAGRIVLIGSTAALDGRGGPYATAKAAMAGYGRDLAVRAGSRGITTNTITPGFVGGTEFFTAGGYGESTAMVDRAAAQTLVGRVGAPADISAAVRWLLGVDAGWVTGQTVIVSGGTDMTR